MKIKGVTTGKRKGNVIELTPEEKPLVALEAHIPTLAVTGESWAIKPKSIKINSNVCNQGGKNKKGYANHSYVATGTFEMKRFKNDSRGRLLHTKDQTKIFKIHVKDVLDKNGLPDLDVTSFEMN